MHSRKNSSESNTQQLLTEDQIQVFQQMIWQYYHKNKRQFPWRETRDPYLIMVSELMLQQTQTFRVVPKYEAFISAFPDLEALAKAELREVLVLWSGLGYNRRARFLHQAAIYITSKLNQFPTNQKELEKIPGIGPYTASAILVFAFNQPLTFIETNIRRVFIHHFFVDQLKVSDKELAPFIAQTVDKENPREWYYALMDYGSFLAKHIPNPNRKSKQYVKQSAFEGSIRKVRGEIIRQLLKQQTIPKITLHQLISSETEERIELALQGLQKDKMIIIDDQIICLA